MTDDEREVRRMFELYRDAHAPGAGVQDRVWRSVEAQMTGGAGGGDAGGQPAGGSGGGAGSGATLGAGTKALLAGGVVAGALVLGWWFQPESQAARERPVTGEAPRETAREPARGGLVPEGAPSAPRGATDAADAEQPVPAAAPVAPPRQPEPAHAQRSPAPTLAAEMALMTAAQAAANDGHHADALRLLSRHRRRFPEGALAEEREAERVMALCALGRKREAGRIARSFLERFPGSPLSARVRGACKWGSP